jgi:hypothetical protein
LSAEQYRKSLPQYPVQASNFYKLAVVKRRKVYGGVVEITPGEATPQGAYGVIEAPGGNETLQSGVIKQLFPRVSKMASHSIAPRVLKKQSNTNSTES